MNSWLNVVYLLNNTGQNHMMNTKLQVDTVGEERGTGKYCNY
jgi:hypothetical protein